MESGSYSYTYHGTGIGLVLLIILLFLVLHIVPFMKLLPRAGISGWLGIIAVIPLGALILLWVLAFMKWPGDA